MKKVLLLLSFFMALAVSAQDVSETYYFSNPQVVDHQGYVLVEFPGTMQSSVLGNPMLPYKATQILLPPGCEASDVVLEYGDLIPIASKGVLFPKQPVRPVSSPEITKFYKNDDVYNSKSVYPVDAKGQLTTGFYRGYSIANVAFTPVVYIPSDNSLAYYSSVTVKITSKHTEKAAQALLLLKKTDDIYSKVDNNDAVAKYSSLISSSKSADDYDMLILSTTQYQAAFDTIISMYSKYGITVHFKALSDIYSEMNGRDNQEKIRNYIIQEYTNHSVQYILLGGDVDICPYRGFYCVVNSSSVYQDNDIPADVYFSGLDGTWNTDNDSNWGEIGEDDLYLEVSVSRMPFGNATELNHMIHKITSYQLNPVLGELNSPTLMGEWMYSNPQTYGSDYMHLLVGLHSDNGYTTNGIPTSNPIDTLYEQYSGFNSTLVKQYINAGPSFVYHAGHANETYVMALNNSDISDANFYGVNGTTHNYTFVYTHGCICGAFDYSDCIAEKMVTIANFAVGGCFNSRYGWFNEGTTEGPSEHLNREFVNALYTTKHDRYGMVQRDSKTATAPWVNAPGQYEEGALRWCFYDCNALADPATQIWIDDPYTLSVGHATYISPSDTSFHVTVYNVSKDEFAPSARCVLMYGDQLIGKGVTDENGECDIQIIGTLPQSGELVLYVSAYNTFVNTFSVNVGGSTLMGDANQDGSVSVLDITTVVAYMTYENPQPFNFTLADVNADGQINILDVMGIVNIIFNRYDPNTCEQKSAEYAIEDGVLYIDSPVNIGGIQLVFNDSVSPIDGAFDGLQVVTKSISADKYMLLAYGQTGETIPAGKHALLNVNNSTLNKIIISDEFGCNVEAINGTLGVGEYDKSHFNTVYPNPFSQTVTVKYVADNDANEVQFVITDINGQIIDRIAGNGNGENTLKWTPESISNGIYFINMYVNGLRTQTMKVIYQK